MKKAPLLPVMFAALGAGLLAALFVRMRPPAEPVPATAAGTVVPAPAPAPVVFELEVRDGRVVAGPTTLTVQQGADVVLRVTADRAAELHLHGYDLPLKLAANVPGELKFVARHAGRFEFELHGSHRHGGLGALEVLPR